MIISKTNLKDNELKCLAACIYFESRGEPIEGQHWVGHVVINRVCHNFFPNNIYGVVFQPSQFSWTKNKSEFVIKELAIWEHCLKVATEVLNRTEDPTNNALYFLTRKLNPSWAKKFKIRKIIGNHKFLGN